MERFVMEHESEEATERFAELKSIVSRMEELSESDLSPEEMINESRKLVAELLEHLQSDLHLELSNDVTYFYNQMTRENLLARVENATRVIECVAFDQPISVGSHDHHYANSVTAQPEGLRIAMAEAEALGPVRLLVGLDVKALVGFKNDHLEVSEIDDNEFDLRDTSLRKTQCRHVQGEIRRGDIRYVVMRIPRRFFPEDKLFEEEIRRGGNFIFRGAEVSHTEGDLG